MLAASAPQLIGAIEKTAKQTTDIILYDQKVIVFKMESDVMLYVVGGPEENEVLLYRYGLWKEMSKWNANAQQCCPRATRLAQHPSEVGILIMLKYSANSLRNSVDKRTVIENYDLVVSSVTVGSCTG
jgi:hypothetical protein